MISSLQGVVDHIAGVVVTLDVHGVGYEVHCSEGCLNGISLGAALKIVVYTDVKQDSIKLYGFADPLEKQVFLLLTKVQGLGSKSAAEILSRIDKKELLRTIGAGDVDRLQTIRGIGKKLSQRIVVELKDKVAEFVADRQVNSPSTGASVGQLAEEAIQALEALGFARKDAERAVQSAQAEGKLSAAANSSEIVREALRFV